jgi:hypothetical protein
MTSFSWQSMKLHPHVVRQLQWTWYSATFHRNIGIALIEIALAEDAFIEIALVEVFDTSGKDGQIARKPSHF